MKNKYKFWIILSLIIVFLAGITGGICINKYHILKKPKWLQSDKTKRTTTHFPSLEIMARELNLTPEQQEQIREIFKSNEERLKNLRIHLREELTKIRSQLKNEIEIVLDIDQKKKFEAMIEKYVSQRKKETEKREKYHKKDKGEKK